MAADIVARANFAIESTKPLLDEMSKTDSVIRQWKDWRNDADVISTVAKLSGYRKYLETITALKHDAMKNYLTGNWKQLFDVYRAISDENTFASRRQFGTNEQRAAAVKSIEDLRIALKGYIGKTGLARVYSALSTIPQRARTEDRVKVFFNDFAAAAEPFIHQEEIRYGVHTEVARSVGTIMGIARAPIVVPPNMSELSLNRFRQSGRDRNGVDFQITALPIPTGSIPARYLETAKRELQQISRQTFEVGFYGKPLPIICAGPTCHGTGQDPTPAAATNSNGRGALGNSNADSPTSTSPDEGRTGSIVVINSNLDDPRFRQDKELVFPAVRNLPETKLPLSRALLEALLDNPYFLGHYIALYAQICDMTEGFSRVTLSQISSSLLALGAEEAKVEAVMTKAQAQYSELQRIARGRGFTQSEFVADFLDLTKVLTNLHVPGRVELPPSSASNLHNYLPTSEVARISWWEGDLTLPANFPFSARVYPQIGILALGKSDLFGGKGRSFIDQTAAHLLLGKSTVPRVLLAEDALRESMTALNLPFDDSVRSVYRERKEDEHWLARATQWMNSTLLPLLPNLPLAVRSSAPLDDSGNGVYQSTFSLPNAQALLNNICKVVFSYFKSDATEFERAARANRGNQREHGYGLIIEPMIGQKINSLAMHPIDLSPLSSGAITTEDGITSLVLARGLGAGVSEILAKPFRFWRDGRPNTQVDSPDFLPLQAGSNRRDSFGAVDDFSPAWALRLSLNKVSRQPELNPYGRIDVPAPRSRTLNVPLLALRASMNSREDATSRYEEFAITETPREGSTPPQPTIWLVQTSTVPTTPTRNIIQSLRPDQIIATGEGVGEKLVTADRVVYLNSMWQIPSLERLDADKPGYILLISDSLSEQFKSFEVPLNYAALIEIRFGESSHQRDWPLHFNGKLTAMGKALGSIEFPRNDPFFSSMRSAGLISRANVSYVDRPITLLQTPDPKSPRSFTRALYFVDGIVRP